MNEPSEAKMLNRKYNTQRTQYTQYTELHRSQKQIINSQFAVAFSIPQQEVISLFRQVAKRMNFEMIEVQQNYATAVKKPPKKSIFQLLNCLNWWGPRRQAHAIKLIIFNNTNNFGSSLKLCKLKGLSQPSPDVLSFIQIFKQKMQQIKGIVPTAYLFESTPKYYEPKYQVNSNPFHLEACAFYTFNRILTSPDKQEKKIRQSIQKSLKQFFQAFKNVQQSSSSLPTPLLNLMQLIIYASGIIKQACFQIQKLLQTKKDKAQNIQIIMPYIKISVEKYIFDRTQTMLKAMYIYRDMETIQKFKRKRIKIITKLKKAEIFQQLLINKTIRQIQKSSTTKSKGGIQFCACACPELQKIVLTSSPRQKIKHTQLMYAQLKSYFYQRLKMKYQLNSMEDIIPVLILIVIYTEIEHLRSELNLMIDFVNGIGDDFQAEKRLLVNLSQSYNYVVRDWKVSQ